MRIRIRYILLAALVVGALAIVKDRLEAQSAPTRRYAAESTGGAPKGKIRHDRLVDNGVPVLSQFDLTAKPPLHAMLLKVTEGQLIYAPVGGEVAFVGNNCTPDNDGCNNGLGNTVVYTSEDTGHYIVLAALGHVADGIKIGSRLQAGQKVGVAGKSGWKMNPVLLHVQVNPTAAADDGSTNPAWEFPWLACGNPDGEKDKPFGALVCN